jgi:cysteinyl-tRNA synthetase
MSWKHLGEIFDIHGGGIDLVFPHHENEIAQSRCAFHSRLMANFWMHNGFLQVEGRKMAKSEGNFITIRELLDDGWPGEALRFNMLRTHYRQPIDWTSSGLDASHQTLWSWYGRLHDIEPAADVPAGMLDALCDDLNTPRAIAELHRLDDEKNLSGLLCALRFLGLSGRRSAIARSAGAASGSPHTAARVAQLDARKVDELVEARNAARRAKDFKEADRIRDELAAMRVVVKDTRDGTTWEVAR